jgi:dipeptidyl aminopeptidase/acylaminoacyl peptidase
MACFTSNPHEIYAVTLNNGARERNLSRANDDLLAQVELAATKRMTSKAADGVESESYVLYPPGYAAGKRYPLMLDIHGGPHGAQPAMGFNVQAQAWACAGYVVLMPNPRGSAGYGEAFQLACVNDWGGGDYDDLMCAVDALVKKGAADPERLYVGGYSYGGFMTTWVVGHTGRFRAALIGAPVSNHLSMVGTSDIPLFSNYEIGSTQHDNREEWVKRSPLTHLPDCTTPVLIEHHEGDLRCPITQSEEIFATLKMAGKEVEFLRYPGGFHGFDTHAPSQTVDAMERALDWFNTHGGKPPAKKKARPTAKERRVKASSNAATANGAKPARRKIAAPA